MIKVETLFDQGTVLFIEDYHLFQPPFVVVADGVSPPYNKKHPLKMVDGFTAGAMAAKTVCAAFQSAQIDDSVMACLLRANRQLGAWQQESGALFKQPELLAGASVVAAKLGDSQIQIIQVGDAIALWRLKRGEKGATANSVYQHDEFLHKAFARIMFKVNGNRKEAWERFYEIHCTAVRDHTNRSAQGGFGVINGQPGVVPMICEMRFPRSGLRDLILCSDGLVPFEMTQNSRALAELVFRLYDQGGLKGVLQHTRAEEEKKADQSHISQAEATAVAIKFA